MKRPLLILRTGSALEPIRSARGDFETWFSNILDVPSEIRDARLGVPDPRRYAGLLITGSPAMVSHREPWSEALLPMLRNAVASLPVLGVCYGHQLLAHALGGRVGPNPLGRQLGTVTCKLSVSSNDALFAAGIATMPVHVAHQEVVLAPPPSSVVLGCTDADPHHVLRFGRRAWGLQFHPEFDVDITRRYVVALRAALCAEAMDAGEIFEGIIETPQATGLLRRFSMLVESGE